MPTNHSRLKRRAGSAQVCFFVLILTVLYSNINLGLFRYLTIFSIFFSLYNDQFSLAVNLFACFNFAHLMLMLFISVLLSWLKIFSSMPRFMTVGRMNYLKKLFNFLKRNQNEDCLYLNIYAPEAFGRSYSAKMPVI